MFEEHVEHLSIAVLYCIDIRKNHDINSPRVQQRPSIFSTRNLYCHIPRFKSELYTFHMKVFGVLKFSSLSHTTLNTKYLNIYLVIFFYHFIRNLLMQNDIDVSRYRLSNIIYIYIYIYIFIYKINYALQFQFRIKITL